MAPEGGEEGEEVEAAELQVLTPEVFPGTPEPADLPGTRSPRRSVSFSFRWPVSNAHTNCTGGCSY